MSNSLAAANTPSSKLRFGPRVDNEEDMNQTTPTSLHAFRLAYTSSRKAPRSSPPSTRCRPASAYAPSTAPSTRSKPSRPPARPRKAEVRHADPADKWIGGRKRPLYPVNFPDLDRAGGQSTSQAFSGNRIQRFRKRGFGAKHFPISPLHNHNRFRCPLRSPCLCCK